MHRIYSLTRNPENRGEHFSQAVRDLFTKLVYEDSLEIRICRLSDDDGDKTESPEAVKKEFQPRMAEEIGEWIEKETPNDPDAVAFAIDVSTHHQLKTGDQQQARIQVTLVNQPSTTIRSQDLEVPVDGFYDLRITAKFGGSDPEAFEDQEELAELFPIILTAITENLGVSLRPAHHLALSGGGFRATLYHLGVIKAIRDVGLLNSLHSVSSVSGGSIMAGHLFAFWQEYAARDEETFNERASRVVSLAQENFRRRILLQMFSILLCVTGIFGSVVFLLCLFDVIQGPELVTELKKLWDHPIAAIIARLFCTFLLVLLVGWMANNCFGQMATWLASRRLSNFCGGKSLEEARKGGRSFAPQGAAPYFFINTSSLNSSRLCSFTPHGFIRDIISLKGEIRERTFHTQFAKKKVGEAVMASSAFPIFFGPVKIDLGKRINGTLIGEESLADGGLFDNSGVALIRNTFELNRSYKVKRQKIASIIVSDAGSAVLRSRNYSYSGLVGRLKRSISVLMESKALEVLKRKKGEPNPIKLRIQTVTFVDNPEKFEGISLSADRLKTSVIVALAKVRTDLDSFSEITVRALVQHGYVKCLAEIIETPEEDNLFSQETRHYAAELLARPWYQGVDGEFVQPNEHLRKLQRDGLRGGLAETLKREVRGFLKAFQSKTGMACLTLVLGNAVLWFMVFSLLFSG